MKPRWKGKGLEAEASADPMSKIVSQLQSSLIRSEARGSLSSRNVLIKADAELFNLFNRACFGRMRITSQEEKQWFQLDMEEAFYLCYSLECLKSYRRRWIHKGRDVGILEIRKAGVSYILQGLFSSST
ncbi:hypothetical protein J1N35_045819 [Gossypium stocksii]|uniref:tRNA intron endonuclease N-terminal domain-containing protein n=1 Tax=Gossypium stocksii TaxID=47602 RepID=A0A9D3UBW7_9ROSI|nr:hypothetical protein J1N35_045819 [Gossypium stocksii]